MINILAIAAYASSMSADVHSIRGLISASSDGTTATVIDTLPLSVALPVANCDSPGLITRSCWDRYFSDLRNRAKHNAWTDQITLKAFMPAQTHHVRAIFLESGHGIGTLDNARLRDFARRNAVALVWVDGDALKRGFYPVEVIKPYLKRLAHLLKHPEVNSAPIIAFGHSNGTGLSGIVASQQPDRVIAWISYHSGGSFHLQFPNTDRIPALILHGPADPFFANSQADTVKLLRAERNAPLTFTMEPVTPHFPLDRDRNATWDFIASYAEAAMRIRLKPDGTLKPIVIKSGWLGVPYDMKVGGFQTLKIAPYDAYRGDPAGAVWLPDERFARIWQRYGATDPRGR